MQYINKNKLKKAMLNCPHIEVLAQCTVLTWDGDLISSNSAKALADEGKIVRFEGFNIITLKGLDILYVNGILDSAR